MSIRPRSLQTFIPSYEKWMGFLKTQEKCSHGNLPRHDYSDEGLWFRTPNGIYSLVEFCEINIHAKHNPIAMFQKYTDNVKGLEYVVAFGPAFVSNRVTINPPPSKQSPIDSLTVSNSLDMRNLEEINTRNTYINLSNQSLSKLKEQGVLPANAATQIHIEQYRGVISVTVLMDNKRINRLNEEQYRQLSESIGLHLDFFPDAISGEFGHVSFNLPYIDVSKLDPDSVFKILKGEDEKHPFLFPMTVEVKQ